ncbi:sodium/hydrogen exchanger 9B2-like isoform X1 [Argonauta hians]
MSKDRVPMNLRQMYSDTGVQGMRRLGAEGGEEGDEEEEEEEEGREGGERETLVGPGMRKASSGAGGGLAWMERETDGILMLQGEVRVVEGRDSGGSGPGGSNGNANDDGNAGQDRRRRAAAAAAAAATVTPATPKKTTSFAVGLTGEIAPSLEEGDDPTATTAADRPPSSSSPPKSFSVSVGPDETLAIPEGRRFGKTRSTISEIVYRPCVGLFHRGGLLCGTEQNPLPENPTCWQRFKFAFMCPPHGTLSSYLTSLCVFTLLVVLLMSLLGQEALPGTNIFSLWVVLVACILGGYIIQFIYLPPLLGMLITGIVLKNVPEFEVAQHVHRHWSATLRHTALTIILIRAGLGLNPVALRKLSFAVVRLAFMPCLTEALVVTVASHFFMGLPWIWGLMLGFVVAAVSPAVVVPCLLYLQEHGYGTDKGIPTLIIAAASIDDVLAITGFGVVYGIAFSEGNIVESISKGPLEAILGVLLGGVGGVILWYIPNRGTNNWVFLRGVLLYGMGLAGVLGSPRMNMPGMGPLLALTVSFVGAIGWRMNKETRLLKVITNSTAVMWLIFQPLLFGLIGSEVNFKDLHPPSLGYAFITVMVGLVFRLLAAFFAVFGTNLLRKEKLFVAMAWLPKATVQAAIGSVALSAARENNRTEFIPYGAKILDVAVLVILITAPLGSALIMLTGPKLLFKGQSRRPSDNAGS